MALNALRGLTGAGSYQATLTTATKKSATKRKRVLSPEGRAAIIAAAKKRWAANKAASKKAAKSSATTSQSASARATKKATTRKRTRAIKKASAPAGTDKIAIV